jgi:hypothetical protein
VGFGPGARYVLSLAENAMRAQKHHVRPSRNKGAHGQFGRP